MGRLDNKVCIVTGSTSGIGEACAKDMAREGGTVVVSGRNEKEGARVVDEITTAEGEAIFVRADVTSEDDIRSLVATGGGARVRQLMDVGPGPARRRGYSPSSRPRSRSGPRPGRSPFPARACR